MLNERREREGSCVAGSVGRGCGIAGGGDAIRGDIAVGLDSARGRGVCLPLVKSLILRLFPSMFRTRAIGGGVASSMLEPGLGGDMGCSNGGGEVQKREGPIWMSWSQGRTIMSLL